MGWFNKSRKNGDDVRVGATIVGLDLNATRMRAQAGEVGRPPRTVILDDPHEDLPLAVSLEHANYQVGRPALAIARRLPHLVCSDYLNDLGQPREWKNGRKRLDAAALLALAVDRLRMACPRSEFVTLVLPTYLSPAKVAAVNAILERANLTVRTSLILPLALVSAQGPTERRRNLTLIVDVDDHALTGALIQCEANEAHLLATTSFTRFNLRVWRDRLLNGLADRCVRTCRRDPRDSAVAEQALYDQIDGAVDRARQGQPVTLTVRSAHWYQDLVQTTDDFEGYCANLAKQSATLMRDLAQSGSPDPPAAVWLTDTAGRLPGLAAALNASMAERTELQMMPPGAGARAAVFLAGRMGRDELPRGHLDAAVALPESAAEPKLSIVRDGTGGIAPIRTLRFDK